jgi:uncharacterized membrane protein YtjA (UPF0391 family)
MGALTFLSVVAGLLAFGVIPTEAVGLARSLLGVYLTLLAVSLGVAIIWL